MAGVRQPPDGNSFMGSMNAFKNFARMTQPPAPPENTVIGVVATNARLSKAYTNKVAEMAHDGLARAVNPAHTMREGDTIFALTTGQIEANESVIGAFAAETVAQAIRNAIRHATSLHSVRAWNE